MLCHSRVASEFTASGAFFAKLFQRPHAAFVTGTAGFDALTDPHFFLSQLFIKFSLLAGLNLKVVLFFIQVCLIITRVAGELASIKIHNAGSHGSDKRPVVADKYNGALILLQALFQPADHLYVQVVGGLIEQQDIRRSYQRARQRSLASPTTRQRCQRGITVQLQHGQRLFNFLFKLPGILNFKLLL